MKGLSGTDVTSSSTKPRSVLIEHPRPDDPWRVAEPNKPTEESEKLLRFRHDLGSGEMWTLSIKEERSETVERRLKSISSEQLLELAKHAEGQARETIARFDELRDRESELQTQLTADETEWASIATDQSRIRENMRTLDKQSELYQRYLATMKKQEDAIDKLRERERRLNQEIEAVNSKLKGLSE